MPIRTFKRFSALGLALGLCALFPARAHAARVAVDGIVAVVDGTPIFLSDVEDLRQAMLERPGFSGTSVSQQRRDMLDRLIDEKVLVAKAKQDTNLKVTDKEVDARADEWYGRLVQQQGGEKQLELALEQSTGMTTPEFKDRIREQMRDQIYRQKLQEKFVGDLDPSQLQVQEFFAKYKDSLPVQRDGVHLSHIQWRIKADFKIDSTALDRADSLIRRLDKGESFSDLAKSYSEDYSGRDGGDLGYTKRGMLDPDYERAAFALDMYDYTPHPVRTRFGYHIIRLTGKRDNEIRTSHILIKVVPSSDDTARALAFMDSVEATLKTDSNFIAAAKSLSDDRQTRDLGGDLGWFQEDSLDANYKEAVDTLPEGGVSAPILISDSYHLFRVNKKVSERHLTLDEDYAVISGYAKEMLITQKLDGLIKKWREHIAIEDRLAQFQNLDTTSSGDETQQPAASGN